MSAFSYYHTSKTHRICNQLNLEGFGRVDRIGRSDRFARVDRIGRSGRQE